MTRLHFFVVEIFEYVTVFGTAAAPRGGVGTRLGRNQNMGKIIGTRVDRRRATVLCVRHFGEANMRFHSPISSEHHSPFLTLVEACFFVLSQFGAESVRPALGAAARNKFERFRGFLELISRFEFDFRRCGMYILNDSNFFGVFKVQSDATRLYMCMCCGLFVPHNSISTVVVSLTIHDNQKLFLQEMLHKT